MSRRVRSGGRGLPDWKAIAGLLVSGALLYWAFRDVDLGEVMAGVREADLLLLILAGAAATAVFPLRAFRWGPLLKPVAPHTRYRSRFGATCIGFGLNNLLPARVGEFARAYALSRIEPVRVSASLGSLVVARIFDGLVVVLFLLGSLAWPSFPEVSGRDFTGGAMLVGGVFLGVFLVLLLMASRPEQAAEVFDGVVGRFLPKRFREPIRLAVGTFLEGLSSINDWRLVLQVFGWSLSVWLMGALGFWLGFKAFGIDVPFVGGVFLGSVIALAVALPSAPGFFGLFEAGARIGLVEVWGVESTQAVAFAIGFHLAGFIPITLMGLYYVWRFGFSWKEVERSEQAVEVETVTEARS
ncbi:MAG TPA: lysylphosphatidylglycerol synthase transmembrane domain-containing protein [Longimicrobiales bacterium]|nr:lysylphosphatidylglycerol synthase transmembrane domain-containing protein [Longimicrobiales bacterium]